MRCFSITLIMIVFFSLQAGADTERIKHKALHDLKSLLYSQTGWIKVHVAEFLLWEHYAVDEVRALFMEEERKYDQMLYYRIGVWRVLAQAAATDEERRGWLNKILAIYSDEDSPERVHAIETLAKLKYPVARDLSHWAAMQTADIDAFAVYSIWNASFYSDISKDAAREMCLSLLRQQRAEKRTDLMPVVSYVLRRLKPFEPAEWDVIRAALNHVEANHSLYANILATLWMTAPEARSSDALDIKKVLTGLTGDRAVQLHVFAGWAECGEQADTQELIAQYLSRRQADRPGYDADVHAIAAYAVLKVAGRLDQEKNGNKIE